MLSVILYENCLSLGPTKNLCTLIYELIIFKYLPQFIINSRLLPLNFKTVRSEQTHYRCTYQRYLFEGKAVLGRKKYPVVHSEETKYPVVHSEESVHRIDHIFI